MFSSKRKIMNDESFTIGYKYHKLKISYTLTKGSGPIVLYLHGLGCSKKDFESALRYKDLKEYSLMAVDFPGSYGSEYPDDIHLTIDDLVEITNIFLSSLGIKKVILVGHSMGGLVGLLFAEKFPQRVAALINIEGNLAPEDCFLSRKAIGLSFEIFKKNVWREIQNTVKFNQSKGSQAYLKNLAHVNPRTYYDLCASLVNYSDRGDLVERFIKLPMPKTYIYGEENRTLSHIPTLKAHINTIEIPNSGHTPSYDNPNFYYKALASFIASIM